MKKIETLLNIDTNGKFDTPKKLNRSSKAILPQTVEQLEDGIFTSEMIKELAKSYPVYRYRTCITVHGLWPEVERTRIGGYKNVHQNQNGSVEIYYSAIDKEKIDTIREQLRGTTSPFRYSENSTSREFAIYRTVTKETLPQVRAELEPIARELSELNIYGYVNLYLAADMFRNYLVLSLHPLAIPAAEVSKLILKLSRLSKEEHEAQRAAYIQQQAQEEQQRKADYEALKQRQAAAEAAKAQEIINVFKPQVAHLKECADLNRGILVGIAASTATPQINFVFYRKDGNGSFGRIKYSKALSRSLSVEGLQWKEQKQSAPGEVLRKNNTYYLLESAPTPAAKKPQAPVSQPGKVLMTINY